ncbi:MAG: fimbrial protein [Chania sp.]
MKMWKQITGAMLLLHGIVASAADIPLGGVPVSVMLTNLPKITVAKPGGGWYDILTLSNSGGSDVAVYRAQVPVEVEIRNERNFMVSLTEPLVLTHETDTSLTFTTENVSFGNSSTTLQPLSTTPIDFSNPPMTGDISTGDYLLSISGRQPSGVLGNISGNYQGKLVLLFEVKV